MIQVDIVVDTLKEMQEVENYLFTQLWEKDDFDCNIYVHENGETYFYEMRYEPLFQSNVLVTK